MSWLDGLEDDEIPEYSPKRRQERALEKYLKERCEELGIKERKLKFPGRDGAPDRVIGGNGVGPVLIEIKDKNGKLSAQQESEHWELSLMGFDVYVVYSKEDVDNILGTFA